ncbi:MAG: hypothetical protein PHQ11_17565, partial [Paludibacter sp.]|nr:hypothetical protein [Paludibacter sp.]
LTMAELEADLGIAATYYFRNPRSFDTPLTTWIRDLSHEVGYHYEVLAKAKGDQGRDYCSLRGRNQSIQGVKCDY